MRYFINANIVKHFTHALFKNGIYLIHLWLQLQVYISCLNSHYYYAKPLHSTDLHYFNHALITGIMISSLPGLTEDANLQTAVHVADQTCLSLTQYSMDFNSIVGMYPIIRVVPFYPDARVQVSLLWVGRSGLTTQDV